MKLNIFRKEPLIDDVLYVENIHEKLRTFYGNKFENYFENFEYINNIEVLTGLIYDYANKLDLNIRIEEIDEIEDDLDEMPTVYEWEVIDEETNETIIYLTPFAHQNLQITICEVILLLLDMKLKISSSFDFEDEQFQDIKNVWAPLLVNATIFFGFGYILLKRHSVTGYYKYSFSYKGLNITYRVPLHLKTMIYSIAFKIMVDNKIDDWNSQIKKTFNSEIQKEMDICLNFIMKGKSEYFNWMKSNNLLN
ncbi:MAG: hypothetical protein V4622_14310 [Bacteroidota bacterium]